MYDMQNKKNHHELNTDFLDTAPLPPRWAAAAALARSHSDHGLKRGRSARRHEWFDMV